MENFTFDSAKFFKKRFEDLTTSVINCSKLYMENRGVDTYDRITEYMDTFIHYIALGEHNNLLINTFRIAEQAFENGDYKLLIFMMEGIKNNIYNLIGEDLD